MVLKGSAHSSGARPRDPHQLLEKTSVRYLSGLMRPCPPLTAITQVCLHKWDELNTIGSFSMRRVSLSERGAGRCANTVPASCN